ncbi:MAG: TonB-dependent receptor [Chitinophagales bacterium]
MKVITRLIIFINVVFFSNTVFGQSVTGVIIDSQTKQPLPGVTIIAENNVGTISDVNGKYNLVLESGAHEINFTFIGYEKGQFDITVENGKSVVLNVTLTSAFAALDVVVVSGSLYAKKLSEETQSIEVIKSDLISATNSTNLSDAITKAPGVYMMDEQANIRGGTGFTYGAGSRIMLVVDDQIMLAADRGDAKWNFVPMENVEQIEIIKGASSVLYGSSALNGVIAVRTAWPKEQPESNITVYHGIIDKPSLEEAAWWDHAPTNTGIIFSHRQKFDKMDLVLGGHISQNNSHLLGQYSDRARLNWKTRFHPENNDRLYWGVNGNVMSDREGIFFLWEDYDTSGFLPFQGYLDTSTTTLLNWQFKWVSIDPWLNYYDKHKNEHHFKMRFYNNDVDYSDSTDGNAYLINLDYQFHREFNHDVILTAGMQGYYFDVDDHDLGIHSGVSAGLYVQADKKLFERLILNVGVREEFYQIDTAAGSAVPIFKGGLNYKAGRLTNLRLSFGQGYRFPSLVEKFAKSNLGSLFIFPNPDLLPEYGWNAEFGIKRAIDADLFKGYADIAFYVTDYYEMTEFTFNFYPDEGAGFKSLNTSRARIGGIEFTLGGEAVLGKGKLNWLGGYNYIYPADISGDSSNLEVGNFMQNFIDGFTAKSTDTAFLNKVLKYRFRHMLKMDINYEINRWSFGTDISYFSLMENLDAIYISFIPGINEYREQHLDGDWIADFRVGYHVKENMRLQLLVKNAFNNMYALRPAKYDPPRSFTFQYKIDF